MLKNYDSLSKIFAETERSKDQKRCDFKIISNLPCSKPVLNLNEKNISNELSNKTHEKSTSFLGQVNKHLDKLIKKEISEESNYFASKWYSSSLDKTTKCSPVKNEKPSKTNQSFISGYFASSEASTSKTSDNVVKITAFNEETSPFYMSDKKETSETLEVKDEIVIIKETKTSTSNVCNTSNTDSWQSKKSTFSSKMVHIYLSGVLSDVRFIVDTIHEIKGHKLLFAMQSEVFENLFKIHQDNIVPITNVPIKIFEFIVKYVYMIPPDFQTKEEVKSTYTAAETYNLITLKRHCCKCLGKYLNLSNIFTEYEESYKLGDYLMIEQCKKFLNRNFQKVIQSKEFLQLSKSSIKNILNDRNSNPKDEALLFNATKQWATERCGKNQQSLRDNMQEFLPYIRFLNMENSDFISGPAKSGILTPPEITSIIMNIDVPDSVELPSWCNRTRNVQQTKRKRTKSAPTDLAKKIIKKKQKRKNTV